jgi:hypothetical protein
MIDHRTIQGAEAEAKNRNRIDPNIPAEAYGIERAPVGRREDRSKGRDAEKTSKTEETRQKTKSERGEEWVLAQKKTGQTRVKTKKIEGSRVDAPDFGHDAARVRRRRGS